MRGDRNDGGEKGGTKLCNLFDIKACISPLSIQSGGLIYFLLQEWQFVNEFKHVLGKILLVGMM